MKNSTLFAKVIEICARKLEKIWRVDHQLCLREKLLLQKFLSGIPQMSANQLLELMRASSIPIQCVKTCQQGCTQDGSLIRICKKSRLDITYVALLRTWSCLSTKKPDQNAELRAFTHLEIKRKLTVSMLMDIAITAKQCLKQWDAITSFVLAKRSVPHLAMTILREETKGESWMTWDVSIFAKKDTKLKRFGNVSGGKASKRTKK